MRRQFQDILRALRQGQSARLVFQADGESYVRAFQPKERLLLLGGGHIAQPVCRYAADLGFAVTVADDRPSFANSARFPDAEEVVCEAFPKAIEGFQINETDYVAVITRGHRYDADCLRSILPGVFPRYLGMIGSRRRVKGLMDLLRQEGFPPEKLERIHAPIGLDIGALTVKEIAVSILAELIQCRRREPRRRQDTPRHSQGELLALQDIDLPLLEFLAADETPKAVMIVCETVGSTPVKSGAMMALDKNYRSAGTIGGGCGESAVTLEAYRLIGTGQSRCVTVDMTNDAAEEEGMVCGGQMKALIADISDVTGE